MISKLPFWLGQYVRQFVVLVAMTFIAACGGPRATDAAPFAAYVMDARTGETLYSDNADTRLHPASLTKMMTLYITFQEIEAGRLSLDSMVTVSKNAAAQPPSRLGLKAGQKIQVRYLIRAAAVKSANDAAAALGDAIGGNQQKFAARMTRTAKSLGMANSTFKNANGLTAQGHLSTAHDMAILGRHLFYDFPQYYNIFSRRSTDAGLATVQNTNRRFLDKYPGADGIKTGFTVPAGFNLTASAERNGVRIIATVFGGTSTDMRNAKMADLLDLGFAKARPGVAVKPPVPARPADEELVASAAPLAAADDAAEGEDADLPEGEGGAGKTLRVVMAPASSQRPRGRPDHATVVAAGETVDALADSIASAVAEANAAPPEPGTLEAQAVEMAAAEPAEAEAPTETVPLPEDTLASVDGIETVAAAPAPLRVTAQTEVAPVALVETAARPAKRRAPIYDDPVPEQLAEAEAEPQQEVVTQVSTSGGRHWGINVGRYNSWAQADKVLMKTQLAEGETLGQSLRKIVQKSGGFDANFLGLGQQEAERACLRLQAKGMECFTLGPG
jgi:D-alanyl-D-alanine carboxypeptidase